jgi:hypothetical protein
MPSFKPVIALGKIWIGSVGNIAPPQTSPGDLTVSGVGALMRNAQPLRSTQRTGAAISAPARDGQGHRASDRSAKRFFYISIPIRTNGICATWCRQRCRRCEYGQ